MRGGDFGKRGIHRYYRLRIRSGGDQPKGAPHKL
jgi:hypothetical protein